MSINERHKAAVTRAMAALHQVGLRLAGASTAVWHKSTSMSCVSDDASQTVEVDGCQVTIATAGTVGSITVAYIE
jgi:hypothetical protein